MDEQELHEPDYTTIKQQLEIEKLRMEIEKIHYDTTDVKKKWYKKPQWIMALSPLLIGCFTLIVAWASGFLQAQSTLNKIQQETFNQKKDSIDHVIGKAITTRDSLLQANHLLVTKNAFYDSVNKLASDNLSILADSLKTVGEKRKFFSDKLVLLERENLQLKFQVRDLGFKTTLSFPSNNFKARMIQGIKDGTNIDSLVTIYNHCRELDSIARYAHF